MTTSLRQQVEEILAEEKCLSPECECNWDGEEANRILALIESEKARVNNQWVDFLEKHSDKKRDVVLFDGSDLIKFALSQTKGGE